MNELTTADKKSSDVATRRPSEAAQATAQILTIIANAAKDPTVDVGKLERLLEMQRSLMREQHEMEARQAIQRVCATMPRIKKSGIIDFNKAGERVDPKKQIPYAKWENIQDAIRPIYEAEGFTLRHDTEPRQDGGGLICTAILTHENGTFFKASIPLPLDTSGGKQNIQGMGSSASYGQRYSTKLLFNLVFEGEDDDGKLAGVTFIEPSQVKEVQALIDETRTDAESFLEMIGHTNVESISKAELPIVLNMLFAKRDKIKEKNLKQKNKDI